MAAHPPATPPPSPLTAEVVHLEDDLEWSQLVGQWVRRRGLSFHSVKSRAELRAYLSRGSTSPRCLILDSQLDSDDGLAICDLLKASPSLQSVPVIILTGLALSQEEALRHGALQVVLKDARAEKVLDAVLGAVLSQHEHSRGIIEADDIRLDPHQRTVLLKDVAHVPLAPGPFAVLKLLILSSPETVPDGTLYQAFLERHPYQKPDHELSARSTLRNYISRLRGDIGPRMGRRIVRRPGGYAYVPPEPLPRL